MTHSPQSFPSEFLSFLGWRICSCPVLCDKFHQQCPFFSESMLSMRRWSFIHHYVYPFSTSLLEPFVNFPVCMVSFKLPFMHNRKKKKKLNETVVLGRMGHLQRWHSYLNVTDFKGSKQCYEWSKQHAGPFPTTSYLQFITRGKATETENGESHCLHFWMWAMAQACLILSFTSPTCSSQEKQICVHTEKWDQESFLPSNSYSRGWCEIGPTAEHKSAF